MDALGETVVVHHPIDREVFYCDQVKSVHDAAAVLMGEVAAPPGNALMDARHDLTPLSTLRCIVLFLRQTPLRLRQCFLLSPEGARVGDFSTRRESGKGLETNVNPDLLTSRW